MVLIEDNYNLILLNRFCLVVECFYENGFIVLYLFQSLFSIDKTNGFFNTMDLIIHYKAAMVYVILRYT